MPELSLISDAELLAWLDEDLHSARMSEIELQLRDGLELQRRVSGLISERDQGALTVGEVWRRHGLSCPTRHELGSYLLQALEPGPSSYIQFHLNVIGCRKCLASYEDLQQSQAATPETIERRQRIFASSVSQLKRDGSES
ncbi:MAG: hypothetical protein V4719_28175 [Planctomycetota bacterium]